mmetsp:Transcript_31974/g.94191  ORF Transcript_31974/g.94191 Transcript_31974/m.94191 type:complete len:304 (+) Transcript_31974:764-1675(+)
MEQGERELQVSRGEAGRWRARARHVGRRSQQQPVPVVQQRRQRQLVDKARYQPLVRGQLEDCSQLVLRDAAAVERGDLGACQLLEHAHIALQARHRRQLVEVRGHQPLHHRRERPERELLKADGPFAVGAAGRDAPQLDSRLGAGVRVLLCRRVVRRWPRRRRWSRFAVLHHHQQHGRAEVHALAVAAGRAHAPRSQQPREGVEVLARVVPRHGALLEPVDGRTLDVGRHLLRVLLPRLCREVGEVAARSATQRVGADSIGPARGVSAQPLRLGSRRAVERAQALPRHGRPRLGRRRHVVLHC